MPPRAQNHRQVMTLVNIVAILHIIIVRAHLSNIPEYIYNRFARLLVSEHVGINLVWVVESQCQMMARASHMT